MLNRLIVGPSKTMTQVPCARSEGLVLVLLQPPPATMLIATNGAEFSLDLDAEPRISAAQTCGQNKGTGAK